jgi:ABC-2 type transport system permease protein
MGGAAPWVVVARQELRDLWLGGRGLLILLGFSLLLGVITYLTAGKAALNFLERREAVSLTLQVAVAVGSLLAMLGASDAISGERERGTLESVLLTPVPRAQLVVGKLLAALSLGVGALVVTLPYVWVLGHGVGAVGEAAAAGVLAGTLLAWALASMGIVISARARSSRLSLSVSLLILLALYAPTQLPAAAQHGWAGELLLWVNPVSAAEHYIGAVVVDQHGWTDQLTRLASPALAALGFTAIATTVLPRLLTLTVVAGLTAGALTAATPAAAPAAASTAVSLDRSAVATRVGEDVRMVSTITNTSPFIVRGLVAHLDVVSRQPGVTVDPEDWSSERTRYLPPLAAGRSARIRWTVTTVNTGRFAVYVVALGRGRQRPVLSPPLDVRIAAHQTIDPGTTLPVVVGVPAVLAAALVGTRRRRRGGPDGTVIAPA